ncbi:MAG: CapA family protein [Eubacteriales bacterium]|nr:CapA family protein [Eubacteriales bacterium]
MSRNPKRGNTAVTVLLTVLILLMIAATALVIWLCIDLVNTQTDATVPSSNAVTLPSETIPSPTQTQPPETTLPEPEPEHVVSTATISAQGDLLMHKPVFDTCRKSDGSYDFESIFRYMKEYSAAYDYAVVNLETTFGGDGYPYQGNPTFNCPDPFADSIVDAGYDMLLTANNHCSDTTSSGIKRTLDLVREKGLATLGTQLNDEEPKYSVVDVNGIKIGMLCYTYATGVTSDGRPSLNGLSPVSEVGLVNYFMENNLSKFYSEVEEHLANMKEEGAEATILYIHWGIEYQLQENATQRTIAQNLCDLGIDVIVGGHPHVVEPVALLESTVDPGHKTVCIYSLGNAVSNQRTGISSLFPTGYTEDGALFSVTFEKYSDGSVYVAGADVLPTWVNMHSNNGSKEYNILPLDIERESEWTQMFDLTDANFSAAQKSYTRTMGIVGEGLEECRTYLEQAKADREAYYYDLAYHPENYASEITEATIETTAATDAAA